MVEDLGEKTKLELVHSLCTYYIWTINWCQQSARVSVSVEYGIQTQSQCLNIVLVVLVFFIWASIAVVFNINGENGVKIGSSKLAYSEIL